MTPIHEEITMAEKQKAIGDFMVVWNNEKDREPEFHIFHSHSTEKETNDYKYCVKEEDGDNFFCRECDLKVPTGVSYFGITRRLSEDDS